MLDVRIDETKWRVAYGSVRGDMAVVRKGIVRSGAAVVEWMGQGNGAMVREMREAWRGGELNGP